MKWYWWFLGFVVLASIGVGAYLVLGSDKSISVTLDDLKTPTTKQDPNRAHWGAVIRPFALDVAGQPTTWQKGIPEQLDLVKAMGGTLIRANVESNIGVMDAVVNGARERDLDVLLILEIAGDNPVLNKDIKKDQLYQLGKDLGREWASRYKGKVAYYQLANEVSGTAARRPEDSGKTLPNRYDLQFDLNRAERVAQYERGLADGVKQGDKKAQRMITGHWVLVDIIPYLVQQGVDFEIVGWDWYSDMGINPALTEIDGQPDLDLPGVFTDLGKEFWLAEVNKEAGSFKGTAKEQAEYLTAVATTVLTDDSIKGMVVHMLPDMAAEQGEDTGELGLVSVTEQPNGSWDFGDLKPAYSALKDIFLANQTRK